MLNARNGLLSVRDQWIGRIVLRLFLAEGRVVKRIVEGELACQRYGADVNTIRHFVQSGIAKDVCKVTALSSAAMKRGSPYRTPRQSAQGNAVEIAVHALTHPCVLVRDWCRNHKLVHDLGAFHGAQATAWIEVWSVRRKQGHAACGRDRQKNRSVGPRRLKVNRKSRPTEAGAKG